MSDTGSTAGLVAVSGVTGGVGGLVARALAEAGVPQRLLARRPEKAPQLPGATVERFDYGDQAGCEAALRGVDTFLFVSAAEHPERLAQHRAVAEAAGAAGVRQVVYTSFVGASPTCTFTLGRDHHATEQAIEASGVAYTFLRDNFYADLMPLFAGEDGAIRGPAGDGRAALVARADVARVATVVLRDPRAHAGRTYDLTGPAALSMAEVAQLLTEHRGRAVRFVDETVPEAYASRAHYGAPDWQLDAWVSTYTAIAKGELAHVSGDVEALTGRRATSLAELLSATSGR